MLSSNRMSSFKVYNYLRVPIRVAARITTSQTPIPLTDVSPRGTSFVPRKLIDSYFKDGTQIRIYTLQTTGDGAKIQGEAKTDLYAISELDTAALKRDGVKTGTIKALHIGQTTSRVLAGKQNSGLVTSSNAVQGVPYVDIHNLTDQQLCLTTGVSALTIPPHGFVRYKGGDHFGVNLGTIFYDTAHKYVPFQILQPITDLYYGLISDLQNPLFGGFQMSFDDSPDEPTFLLENGWM
jgi:hypothetical protein